MVTSDTRQFFLFCLMQDSFREQYLHRKKWVEVPEAFLVFSLCFLAASLWGLSQSVPEHVCLWFSWALIINHDQIYLSSHLWGLILFYFISFIHLHIYKTSSSFNCHDFYCYLSYYLSYPRTKNDSEFIEVFKDYFWMTQAMDFSFFPQLFLLKALNTKQERRERQSFCPFECIFGERK